MKLGLPYMGSKRSIAKKIVNKIRRDNPKATHFYDLFGGGGAISFEALKWFEHVHYNELNTSIVALLEDIRANGVTEKYYQWVSRECFQKNISGDDWFAGLLKTCWSFGNNQKDYLFGKDIEETKRLAHMAIVDEDEGALESLGVKKSVLHDGLFDNPTVYEKMRRFKKHVKERCDIQRLQQLQQLEHLQRLQRLQRLERLHITNKSYDEVAIETPVENTVIYLDPPYKGTKQYEEKVSHDKIEDFIKNSPYRIYVSSYEWDGLECCMEIDHRSLLSATNNSKKVVEKLFTNNPGNGR